MHWTIWLAWLAAVPATQPPPPDANPSAWIETESAAKAAKAGITVPLSAGTLKKTELKQSGSVGIDLYAKYETSDRTIFGTIFLYAPTLPDGGLTFLATDEVIRRRWGTATHATVDELVRVAGVKGAGRRVIYEGAYDGQRQLASVAMIVRAGSWIVVGRVTGPATNAGEIKSDLDALVGGMTFPKGSEPLPANVIKTEPCAPLVRTGDARLSKPSVGEAAAFVLLYEPDAVDQKGHATFNPLQETPSRLCLESIEMKDSTATQVFRAVDKSGLPYSPRLYVLRGDAGIVLEVFESRKEPGAFFVLRHGVGQMYAFGKLDHEPSTAQMRALIAGPADQPAFAHFTSGLIAPDGHDDLNVYCNLTVEGCEEAKPAPAKN